MRQPFVFIANNFYSFFAAHRNNIFLKSILTGQQLEITIKRLAHQVLENHTDLTQTVFIGLQPRGIFLSDQIVNEIKKQTSDDKIQYGKLDITFYRDDIRKGLHIANRTDIPFSIEGKNVVLIDDVLYTGRIDFKKMLLR